MVRGSIHYRIGNLELWQGRHLKGQRTKASHWYSVVKLAEIVGMLGITAFYPIQNWKLFETQDPTGLSLPAFVSVGIGCVGFTYVSLKNRLWGLFAANLIGAAFTVAIVYGILAWR